MNPLFLLKRFLAQDLEKRMTSFLIENRVFQYFAHRTSRKADELARKVAEDLNKKPPSHLNK